MREAKQLYIEDFLPTISKATGLSKTQSRKVLSLFCREVGNQLSNGSTVTLRHFGRFKSSTINSYWARDFYGNKRVQKKFLRIYFSPARAVSKRLNGKNKQGRMRT